MVRVTSNTLGAYFPSFDRLLPALGAPLRNHVLLRLIDRSAAVRELTVENEHLNVELARANNQLRRENEYLRRRLAGPAGFEEIIGQSAALLEPRGL